MINLVKRFWTWFNRPTENKNPALQWVIGPLGIPFRVRVRTTEDILASLVDIKASNNPSDE